MVDASDFHIWNEKWILTLPKTNKSPWEIFILHGKCNQNLVDFRKYQSMLSLNLTKTVRPENRLPTTSQHQFIRVFAVSFREYFLDFRGRIAWLKIRFSKMRAPNRLWKIACLNVLMYTSIIYTSSFLTFDTNIGNTPIFHWTESLREEKSYPFHVAPFLQQQGFLHPTKPPEPKNERTVRFCSPLNHL